MQVQDSFDANLNFIISEHFDVIKNDIDIHVESSLIEELSCNQNQFAILQTINDERKMIIEKIDELKRYNLRNIRNKLGLTFQKWKNLIENKSFCFLDISSLLKSDLIDFDCLIIKDSNSRIGVSLCIINWHLTEQQNENSSMNYANYFARFSKNTLTKTMRNKEIIVDSNQIKLFHILSVADKQPGIVKIFQEYDFTSISSLKILFSSKLGYHLKYCAFSEIPNLTELFISCSNGKLLIDDDFLKPLLKLKHLSIYNNNLSVVRTFLNDCQISLIKLNLSANSLTNLNSDIFIGLKSLKQINLSKNKLEECPKFSENLEILNLSQNKLYMSHKLDFHAIQFLKTLDISQNKLNSENFPLNLFDNLKNLENLFLDNNEISNLEENIFWNLKRLITLGLSSNKLEFIHSNLFINLKDLKDLNLKENCLRTLKRDIFSSQANLKYLNLSDNKIDCFPKGLFDSLENLEGINLSSNQFYFLDEEDFSHLGKLKIIYFYCVKTSFSIKEFVKKVSQTNPNCKIETEYF
jgi:hypothetical protein